MGIVQQTHDVMKNFLTKILLLISLTPLVLKAQHFNIRTTEIIFKENSPYIAFGKLHMPLSTCHLISYMEEISNYDGYQNSPLVIDDNGTVVFYLNEIRGAYSFNLNDFKNAYTEDWKFVQDPFRDPLTCATQRLREIDFWHSSFVNSDKKNGAFFPVQIKSDGVSIFSGDLTLIVSLDQLKHTLMEGQLDIIAMKDDAVWITLERPETLMVFEFSLADFRPIAEELGLKMPFLLQGTPIYFAL